jgi:hypothetical protein
MPFFVGPGHEQCHSFHGGDHRELLMADWNPISEFPADCPLWLCVIDQAGERSLSFPCRWTAGGWVNAATDTSVSFHPTHWQHWPQRRFERENAGRLRAIQLLLGAELAELYEVFLQQPTPPGISRLLDKLADQELKQLSRDSFSEPAGIGARDASLDGAKDAKG